MSSRFNRNSRQSNRPFYGSARPQPAQFEAYNFNFSCILRILDTFRTFIEASCLVYNEEYPDIYNDLLIQIDLLQAFIRAYQRMRQASSQGLHHHFSVNFQPSSQLSSPPPPPFLPPPPVPPASFNQPPTSEPSST